jgi:hypothetical protein
MSVPAQIDIGFDFRRDTPEGGDPDTLSPTLRRYHRLLWSKPLPNGIHFELSDMTSGAYLHHRSELGEFFLASDAVIPSFRKERSMAEVVAKVPEPEWLHFMSATYTMGGMMIFPGNRIDRKMTINGARGFHPSVKDRFDLTVECIRRHYSGQVSPLSAVIERYQDFFGLFADFQAYIRFFLLDDIVAPDGAIRFFHQFEDFGRTSPIPNGADAYKSYRAHALHFVSARNRRIQTWCDANLGYARSLPGTSSGGVAG